MLPRKVLATSILTAITITGCNGTTNETINTSTGQYYLAPDITNDFKINGISTFSGELAYSESDLTTNQLMLVRQYNSLGLGSTVLGNWLHNYSSSLD